MANQFHVAHSGTISRLGLIAGPPYFCAQDSAITATTACMTSPNLIDMEVLYQEYESATLTGTVDSVDNLRAARVWLFSGRRDTVIDQGVMDKQFEWYAHYVDNVSQVAYFNDIEAEHAWISDAASNPCDFLGLPYLNNCNFDAAGRMLAHLWQMPLNPSVSTASLDHLHSFSQALYTLVEPADISMADVGYYYAPAECQSGSLQCRLVVFFHGCHQSSVNIGKVLMLHTGLAALAESNNLVILFPQAVASPVAPYNPKGCWDWWSYTGEDYASKSGPQILTTVNIMRELSGYETTVGKAIDGSMPEQVAFEQFDSPTVF
uniref:Uncharacterized protein n=1 Tax=Noctiluca scintillans TaxID=2966 RepID=A0A7S1F1B4_NOCSC